MFVIDCPNCGPRDQSEFAYAGEAHIARPDNAQDLTDEQWAGYVFMRKNDKGLYAERWWHAAGCRKFFNMLRNTATDQIHAVYRIGEEPPAVEADLPRTPSGEASIGSGNDAVKLLREAEDGGA